jgi:hypothetical protein
MSVLAALLATLSLACLAFAGSASAGTVSVRVLGQAPGFATLLPLTRVTTPGPALSKDGGSCSGTTAAAALEQATKGAWEGNWNAGFNDYEVISIEGQSYPFDASSNKNYFWAFWLNGAEASTGICGAQVSAGNEILFFPGCFGSECPAPPNVLAVQAQEDAEPGSRVTFSVVSHPSFGGEATPLSGASVSSTEGSATTDVGGHATLTFSHAGVYAVKVSGPAGGPEAVPAEASVCVHAGNDGNCGTTAPSATGETPAPASTPTAGVLASGPPYHGPFALVARTSGLIDGHVYGPRSAPRTLSGTVLAHSPVSSIELRLHRTRGSRCSSYDGLRERFVPARCGTGSFFKVSTTDTFSYLLPGALAPGRYVLDINATDAAGNRTTLARGTSRIVFYVR